jgi:probable HAF family extracellular repeat protein
LFAVTLNGAVVADPLYYSVAPVGFGVTDVLLNNQGQYVVPAYGSAFLINGAGPNAGQATQITTPGATSFNPTGLNDSGQVVGSFTTASGASSAFLYSNGQVTNLTASAGFIAPTTQNPVVGGNRSLVINDSGEIAGQTYPPGSYTGPGNNLLLYNQGVATNEGLPPVSPQSWLYGYSSGHEITVAGINNSGQVLMFDNASGSATLYSSGAYTFLPTTSNSVIGANGGAINNQGLVAGVIYTLSGQQTPGMYVNGAWQSLGTLGGTSGAALAVNDTGAIVGWSSLAGNSDVTHAFLYQNGTMTDLNSLLPPSFKGITLFGATSINDLGQIVAYGGTSYGSAWQDYLLTPSGETPLVGVTSLPEPNTLTFFGLIAGALCLRPLADRARRGRREVVNSVSCG